MRFNDPMLYLSQKGIDGGLRVICPLCAKPFILSQGAAHPAENNGDPFMAIVCSDKCFIEKLPPTCCWRA